eukprot:m.353612 g.353612  ORF g.353612 m.353612 type:complete len:324 (+) comp16805_c0_seq1:85-1056(+)
MTCPCRYWFMLRASTNHIMSAARRACVVGAILGDAATTPLHWIYNQEHLAEAIGKESPIFFPRPQVKFYEANVGDLSPYGGEFMALAKGLDASQGVFDASVAVKIMSDYFSQWAGYKNHTVKTFEANVADGKSFPEVADVDDTQAACLVKAPLIAVAFAQKGDFSEDALNTIKLTQLHDLPCAVGLAASKLIAHALAGDSLDESIAKVLADGTVDEDVKAGIQTVLAAKDADPIAQGLEWGISCALPAAFQVALLIAIQSETFEQAIETNIRVGGDNCSRAIFLGGLMGALKGAPEAEWSPRVTQWEEINTALSSLLAHSPSN